MYPLLALCQNYFFKDTVISIHRLIYNGPGAVGNKKIPTIEDIIHIITAIIIDFIQPILYNHLNDNSQAIPPATAANKPFPNRKYAIV